MSSVITAIQVNYRVQRTHSAIGALNAAIETWLHERDVDDVAIGAVQVVMDELVGNLRQHEPDNRDPLEVELRLEHDVLNLRLSYRAADFSPRGECEVDTVTPISERRIGGLGLHLIQSLMDVINYEYLNGVICLRMQKHLQPHPG